MKCPYCGTSRDRVVDSRDSSQGEAIRRRRQCLDCGKRWTTYERIEDAPVMVVKKDERREIFDRAKLMAGLIKACEKRPVPLRELEAIADTIALRASDHPEREISTEEIGRIIMDGLRRLDGVAYVRFASVYREFKTVEDFMNELKGLMGGRSEPEGVKGES
jgi:transcriptional repressor NrdR